VSAPKTLRKMHRLLAIGACLLAALGAARAGEPEAPPTRVIERDGLRLRVWLQPRAGAAGELRQGQPATLRVALSSALDDTPLALPPPGAWLDRATAAAKLDDAACTGRIGSYLGGSFTERPWRDLSGYQVLLLNGDASISVLDPQTNFAGKTSLRGVIPLPGAGFDWDLSPAHDQLFVSMPATRQVAMVDMATLAAPRLLDAPGSPGRVRVHPSGRQLWVGVPQPAPRKSNTAVQPAEGGVWLVSRADPSRHAWVATGDGHHEFAFDPDGLAAVTNRDSGSVSFVDGATALERRRVTIGGAPISAAFDARARLFIVAEARAGVLQRFDHGGQPLDRLELAPGIGPMATSPDGRWLLVLNPAANLVHVVDLAAWRRVHDLPVPGRPFQLAYSGAYAYVRALDSDDVTMLQLASLGAAPLVQRFSAGEKRPADAPDLPIAAQFAPLPDDNGVFVLSPPDGTLYTYMQGMNAPMSGISPRGHPLRAVRVARQGLLEISRGVFEAQLVLPDSPGLLLALAMQGPPAARHCIGLALAPDGAAAAQASVPTRVSWRIHGSAGTAKQVEVTLEGDAAKPWPQALPLWVFRTGGGRAALRAERTALTALEGGAVRVVYAASAADLRPGAYYVHLQAAPGGVVPATLARQFASFDIEAERTP